MHPAVHPVLPRHHIHRQQWAHTQRAQLTARRARHTRIPRGTDMEGIRMVAVAVCMVVWLRHGLLAEQSVLQCAAV